MQVKLAFHSLAQALKVENLVHIAIFVFVIVIVIVILIVIVIVIVIVFVIVVELSRVCAKPKMKLFYSLECDFWGFRFNLL